MKNKLSTEPYKGVRDFYPEDFFIQEYLFSTMRSVVQSYGYIPYDASILEPTELYEAKTGEEIVKKQTYTFEDRGGRSVTMRPEMTPTVARMVARKRRELTFPLRWYSIANFFRYERPQRGRVREHWQLNVDIFGMADLSADIEIISIAYNLLKAYGLKDDQFEIRVNDRRLIDKTLSDAGLNSDEARAMQKLLDRKDKITQKQFEQRSVEITGKTFAFDPTPNQAIQDALSKLKKIGVNNAVFWPTLVRGFDYYNGIVFEVFDTGLKNNRSLFGGGRYDNLTDIFGDSNMPSLGFAIGDVTIRDVLETYSLLPEYKPTTQLCICYADTKRKEDVDAISAQLRTQGLNITTADAAKKVGDQVKYADKLKIPFVLCIGSKELESNTFTVKELATGKETPISQSEIASFIKKKLASR